MSKKYLVILQILLKHHPKEMYGLDIVKESEGQLKRGSVYVYLSRLKDAGEISSRTEDETEEGMIPRRLYRLTDQGFKSLRKKETGKGFAGIIAWAL